MVEELVVRLVEGLAGGSADEMVKASTCTTSFPLTVETVREDTLGSYSGLKVTGSVR